MPEGKKNTAPVPAPVRDEDGYSAKTHLHQPAQETATVAATALLADAPEGALPSEVRPEIVTWEKLCEAIQASGKAYNMEMIQKAYELANNAHNGVCRRSGEPYICHTLAVARQVLEQADLLEARYKKQAGGKQEFTVSTQHYSFAVNAFVDLIKQYGGDTYDFSLQETQPYTIIDDVAHMSIEIGILFYNAPQPSSRKSSRPSTGCAGNCSWPGPMCSSTRPTPWRDGTAFPWKNWLPIPICPTSRETTTPSIFPKRSSAPWSAAKTSGSLTGPHRSTS